MPLLDVYGRTHELDAKSIDTIATRLEARRDSAKYMGMLQEYLEAIDFAAAQSILALGCGNGAEVREVLRRPDFRGKVTAIDISADLVERGKGLAEQAGFAGRIEWTPCLNPCLTHHPGIVLKEAEGFKSGRAGNE
jgi:ubiquinone/menaquinone biosynthesis C-methylase UbiE